MRRQSRDIDGTAPTQPVPPETLGDVYDSWRQAQRDLATAEPAPRKSLRYSSSGKILPQINVCVAESLTPGFVDAVAIIPGIHPSDAALAHRIAARMIEGSDLWADASAVGLPVVKRERFCMVVRVHHVEIGAPYVDAIEVAALAEVRRGRIATHRVVRK